MTQMAPHKNLDRWSESVIRYHENPGVLDLYLSTPKKAEHGTWKLFVPGTRTLAEHPELLAYPVVFEKTIFATVRGKLTQKPDASKAREEMERNEMIWDAFAGRMPRPLGLRGGSLLTEGINARSLKTLSPYVSGHDGVADLGPVLFLTSLGQTEGLWRFWRGLSAAWNTVGALHQAGFGHGDIHLSNVMIRTSGDAQKINLIDFSRAKEASKEIIAADRQVLLNHGRVLQTLLGPQKGEFAEEAREQGFQNKQPMLDKLVELEKRVRRFRDLKANDMPDLPNLRTLPGVTGNHDISAGAEVAQSAKAR